MSLGALYVDDWGHLFKITIMEQNVVVNISTATTKKMIFKSPNGVIKEYDADFFTDGSDGIIQFITEAMVPEIVGPPLVPEVPATLNEVGSWVLQGKVTFADGSYHSTTTTFDVLKGLN